MQVQVNTSDIYCHMVFFSNEKTHTATIIDTAVNAYKKTNVSSIARL